MTPENESRLEELRAEYGDVRGGEVAGKLIAVKKPERKYWKRTVDKVHGAKNDIDGVQFELIAQCVVTHNLEELRALAEEYPGIVAKLFDACAELAKGGLDLSGN